MAQTAPITEQLAGELLENLEKGETIGEMEAARKLRQAKGIPSANGRIIVEALILAARGDKEAAESQFQKYFALYHSATIGIAYCAYLFRTRKLKQYLQLTLKMVAEFPNDLDVIRKGRTMLYFSGNAADCIASSKSGANLINDDKASKEFRMIGQVWANNIEAAEKASGASSSDLKVLSETVMEVLESHKSYPVDFDYYPMSSDNSAALIAITDISDPSKVADMNFDLAMAIASKDILQDKNLTAWFECKKLSKDGNADGC